MAAGWDRLESMARTVDLDGGLEARTADPLWALSRQWQVGEFRGDDAAQPAAVRLTRRSVPLATFRPPGTESVPVPFPAGAPLEALAEVTPEPGFGSAQLHASVRAGRRLVRLLRGRGLGAAAELLRTTFRPAAPAQAVEVGEAGRAATALLARWGIDGARLAKAKPTEITAALLKLTPTQQAQAVVVVDEWRAWYVSRGGLAEERTWDDERLEYSFTLGASATSGEVVLRAPEHAGGHLDWYAFDVAEEPDASHGLKAAKLAGTTVTAVPTPARYDGMPASRWWEFENREVHFGDLDAGPADLARLLVAEFATAYGADWFVVPVAVPVGTLTELAGVQVVDTFGGVTTVPSAAQVDLDRTGGAGPRVWRLFELSGDEIGDAHPSPWLFVPPTLAAGLDGPVLERVALARDEAANLAWGIERLVEGPLGRALDRADAWYASQPAAPPAAEPVPAASNGDDWWWKYRLEATAPPWWVPLIPERIDASASAEVRLRRARMQAWSQLGAGQVGPKSVLLDPTRPRWLYEEEVPRSGVQVERAWQLARWHDGSVHVWLQRRKRPGRGERASGVRWDLLEREDGAA